MTSPPPPRPIAEVAAELGIDPDHLIPHGTDKAKLSLDSLARPSGGAGRLVLVSAVTPTRAGEGKTTTCVGLAMALRRLGARAVVCLREPSLGPVFGIKGGGTGGGRAQVVPSDEINLHFTGDLHAVTSAHNLLSALLDNALHHGTAPGLEASGVTWGRVLDVNDRSLRRVVVGLASRGQAGARESRFDITAASEVMAILSLARDPDDLRARLGRVVVGFRGDGSAVTAEALGATDAMTVLLRQALLPNLVQTAEGGPALVHGGPFANIAHGCSSLLATRVGLARSDVVLTEAGFGFDLGGEKFLHLKCRHAGLWPRCVLLVATLRALATHGGAAADARGGSEPAALARGLIHLDRQIANVRAFGLEPVVALNVMSDDLPEGLQVVEAHCRDRGVPVARSSAFVDGGAGAEDLAQALLEALDRTDAAPPAPRFLYDLDAALPDKLRAVARTLYGAEDVDLTPEAEAQLARLAAAGYDRLPVCVAKTHLSLSDDPKAGGDPRGFRATVRELRLSAGAGFVVALMGHILTMPGLPADPAARHVRIGPDGGVRGLMQGE